MEQNSPTNEEIKNIFKGCFVVVAFVLLALYLFYLYATTFVFLNAGWLYIVNNQGDGYRLNIPYRQKIHLHLPTFDETNPQREKAWYSDIPAYTILKIDALNDEKHTYLFYDSDEKSDHGDIDGTTIFAGFDTATFHKNWEYEYKSRPNYILKNNFLYLKGCNFAQKIDLRTGENIWKQEWNTDVYWNKPCYKKMEFQGKYVILTDSEDEKSYFNDETGGSEVFNSPGSPTPQSTSQISPVPA